MIAAVLFGKDRIPERRSNAVTYATDHSPGAECPALMRAGYLSIAAPG